MIMGPFTSTSHIGVQEQAEAQGEYIVKMLGHLSRPGTVALTPSHAATDAWVGELAQTLPTTIWTQCSSYFNEGGRDNLPVQYAWSRKAYFKMLEEPDLSEYNVRMAGDVEPALAAR
jgi:hypothetical protein